MPVCAASAISCQGARSVPPRAVYVASQPGIEMFGRVNSSAASKEGRQINFVSQGEKARPLRGRHRAGQLSNGGSWEMKVDLIQQVVVPPHIVSTRLRPDMLLW